MELRLGIIEGRYTPLWRACCAGPTPPCARGAVGLLKEAGVAMVSVSTLRRVPQAIAARYESMRESFNAQLQDAYKVPDGAVTVQAGIDGVMVRRTVSTPSPGAGRPKAQKRPGMKPGTDR